MISYGIITSSPVNDVLLASSEKGICYISFGRKSQRERHLKFLKLFSHLEVVKDQKKVNPYLNYLRDYFVGKRRKFDLPLDLDINCTRFQKKLYRYTSKIPYGTVVTYGELARQMGQPDAARAIGGGMGRNPIPIIIPCHRVVAAGGLLGGFGAGIKYKKILLGLEGYL